MNVYFKYKSGSIVIYKNEKIAFPLKVPNDLLFFKVSQFGFMLSKR